MKSNDELYKEIVVLRLGGEGLLRVRLYDTDGRLVGESGLTKFKYMSGHLINLERVDFPPTTIGILDYVEIFTESEISVGTYTYATPKHVHEGDAVFYLEHRISMKFEANIQTVPIEKGEV